MFEKIEPAPPDPILGLTADFKKDPSPNKINLGVGVYKAADGTTPVLATVKEAERRIVEAQRTKTYLPIDGSPEYAKVVQMLLFGGGSGIVAEERAATLHTPGGTGGLRLAGDYLHAMHPQATLWLSDPTWANHPAIFQAAGLNTRSYSYFDPATNALDFDAVINALKELPAGDVVLLHGGCHNPTGVDPTPEQFGQIGDVLADRGVLPLVDFAYQGFGDGIEEDAAGLRTLIQRVPEMIICSSFSKNFGLYCDRVGAMTVVAANADATQAVLSQLMVCARRNYSNPASHGGSIVATIFNDDKLRPAWEMELAEMRNRINGMRKLFADTLTGKGVSLLPGGNDFITRQRGMFSMSGLNKGHVARLRSEFAIYIVGSGRINVAGMTESNMDYLCDAIAKVVND